jgi:hypothetical protein
MKWLVRIADKMNQPHQVVRLYIIGRARVGQRGPKRRDLGLNIRRCRQVERRLVGRKRQVDEMPVLVPQMIGIADVLAGLRACGPAGGRLPFEGPSD